MVAVEIALGGKIHLCPNTIGVGVNRTGAFAEYLAVPAKNIFKPSRANINGSSYLSLTLMEMQFIPPYHLIW